MAYITYTKGEKRMIFEVIAYEDVNGKIPVQDFLKQLTPKMRAKMYGMLEILQEKGSMLREPTIQPLLQDHF